MSEKNYEIERDGDVVIIRALGKTRAGLFTAATHALFELMGPNKHPDNDTENEHPFRLEADTSEDLLSQLLREGIRVSDEHRETCQELKLDLITDKQASGHFVGCAVTHFDQPIPASERHAVSISKNEETGNWEAVIRIGGADASPAPLSA